MNDFCPIETAAPLPLAEQVEIEALAKVRRTECARQLSATIKGPAAQNIHFGDRLRALSAELDQEDLQARRRLALERMASPNELIARMKRDWPGQVRAVQRLAVRLQIPLGEAWAQVIGAGVLAVRKRGIK